MSAVAHVRNVASAPADSYHGEPSPRAHVDDPSIYGKDKRLASDSEYKLVEDPQLYANVDPDGIYTAMLSGMPPMMTRNEVAAVLRRDPKTVSEMARSGLIPGVPLPPEGSRMKIVIPKLSVIKYLVGANDVNGEEA